MGVIKIIVHFSFSMVWSVVVKGDFKNIWFMHFLRRLSLFTFLLVIILFLLFLLGNYQNFLDSTLELLINMVETTSLISGIVLLVLLCGTLLFAVIGRDFSLPVWISAAAGLFIIIVLLFSMKFLQAWLVPV